MSDHTHFHNYSDIPCEWLDHCPSLCNHENCDAFAGVYVASNGDSTIAIMQVDAYRVDAYRSDALVVIEYWSSDEGRIMWVVGVRDEHYSPLIIRDVVYFKTLRAALADFAAKARESAES